MNACKSSTRPQYHTSKLPAFGTGQVCFSTSLAAAPGAWKSLWACWKRESMAGMAYIAFYLILVGGKVAFMYGVWRLAKSQGRSPWFPLIASIFCASIVFFALFIKGRAEPSAIPT